MLRFADVDENAPPARLFDCPKNGELITPMGAARFTLLKTFRPETLSVTL